MKKKIMVLTGSRAEYGILKNILIAIQASEELELYLVVTGTHLLPQYGYTVNEIKNDGLPIWKEIPVEITPRRAGDIATSFADTKLAEEILHWKAEAGIDEMCADSWNFTLKNL